MYMHMELMLELMELKLMVIHILQIKQCTQLFCGKIVIKIKEHRHIIRGGIGRWGTGPSPH